MSLLAVQHLTDVWFIFLTMWFQAHKSVAYLEIILPWIIILFQGNMGTRQYFPLLQVLVILLCFGKKQPYFPTAIFIFLARLWTNVMQESKDGLLLHSILRVSILQFSLCFLFFLPNKKNNLLLIMCFNMQKGQLLRLWAFS